MVLAIPLPAPYGPRPPGDSALSNLAFRRWPLPCAEKPPPLRSPFHQLLRSSERAPTVRVSHEDRKCRTARICLPQVMSPTYCSPFDASRTALMPRGLSAEQIQQLLAEIHREQFVASAIAILRETRGKSSKRIIEYAKSLGKRSWRTTLLGEIHDRLTAFFR